MKISKYLADYLPLNCFMVANTDSDTVIANSDFFVPNSCLVIIGVFYKVIHISTCIYVDE